MPSAQVKEEPATRAGDMEQKALRCGLLAAIKNEVASKDVRSRRTAPQPTASEA